MDFPRLAVFQAVARRLSFSQAADDLSLSQPAVSKHIRQLEAELGVQLFRRASNRVELTDAGRILADYAGRVATLSEEVRRVLGELAGLRRGYLRLAASSTPGLYLLPEVVARFGRRYPGIEVSLWLGNSAGVAQQVLQGAADLGFVGLRPELPGLQVRPFAEDQIVLATPPGHRLARGIAFSPDLLAGETLILREAGSGTRQAVEAGLAALQARPARVIELAGCEAVRRGVVAGLGVGFASRRSLTLELAQGLLCISPIPELIFARQLVTLARKDRRHTAATLAFLAALGKTEPNPKGLGDP
ncbi:MAG: LysR family transcriptional regulator [Chloroflexi bacterium]|nr:LysR family transcriptional regulator [Chloroflexota bacterium]